MANYYLKLDGEIVNTIYADEQFAAAYAAENGYEYELVPPPVDIPTPAEQREEAYNTEPIVAWDGKMLTVTAAAQLWQYYAAEGDTETTAALSALIAAAKADIRERIPNESEEDQNHV